MLLYDFLYIFWTSTFLYFFEAIYFLFSCFTVGWAGNFLSSYIFLILIAFLLFHHDSAPAPTTPMSNAITANTFVGQVTIIFLKFTFLLTIFLLALHNAGVTPRDFATPFWGIFEANRVWGTVQLFEISFMDHFAPLYMRERGAMYYGHAHFFGLDLYDIAARHFVVTPAGILLTGLTTFLYTILLYSLTTPTIRTKYFYFFYLISLCSLLVCFLTSNFFIFYLSFEFILIPFFVIVGVWGSRPQRLGAALRLVFFTVLFSLPLVTIIFINLVGGNFSFDFSMLNSTLFPIGYHFNYLFYIASFLAFAVKIPLFPAHVWLPEAHGEAPTFGSVLLAGILLKLGGYGFLRVGYPLFNDFSFDSCINFFPLVYTISILTILYSNFSVFVQVDIKKTIAYYSIGHIGFVTLGLATGAFEGYKGAMAIIIAHGLSAAGLFFAVGYLYEKTHTRALFAYRGVATTAPLFSFFFFLFICANIGLPGTINFAGEQLVLISLIKYSPVAAVLPILGILLNGISSILFINRILFGETNPLVVENIQDLKPNEILVYGLVASPLIFFGFFPLFFVELLY